MVFLITMSTLKSPTTLSVMEHFYTIQGEGYHQGKAAYFVRLGGCDVGCIWCDVKESWNAKDHPKMEISSIINKTIEGQARLAVITGGEPLMYNLDQLTQQLHENDIKTHLETSGAYPLTGTWDWICVSPKKFKPCRDDVLKFANELKVVVYNRSDFQFAEQFLGTIPVDCKLYLQPEWSKEKQMLPLIVEYVKKYPQWEISMQLHKYMNVP